MTSKSNSGSSVAPLGSPHPRATDEAGPALLLGFGLGLGGGGGGSPAGPPGPQTRQCDRGHLPTSSAMCTCLPPSAAIRLVPSPRECTRVVASNNAPTQNPHPPASRPRKGSAIRSAHAVRVLG